MNEWSRKYEQNYTVLWFTKQTSDWRITKYTCVKISTSPNTCTFNFKREITKCLANCLNSLLSNLNFSYPSKVFCLFVRLGSRIFHSYGDVTITGEGLPILTFIVTHLLWDILYNGHHQGPVTLTPTAERLAVELSPPVFFT